MTESATNASAPSRQLSFKTALVLEIAAGRKTETRRIMTPQPHADALELTYPFNGHADLMGWRMPETAFAGDCARPGVWITSRCRCGAPGDEVWIRETAWYNPHRNPTHCYYADGTVVTLAGEVYRDPEFSHPDYTLASRAMFYDAQYRKRPSIHSLRWASRATIRITSLRPEYLHEITPASARAEGCESLEDFRRLWDSINAKRGFGIADDPRVWAITFEPIEIRVAE